jgi:hypothetical protein
MSSASGVRVAIRTRPTAFFDQEEIFVDSANAVSGFEQLEYGTRLPRLRRGGLDGCVNDKGSRRPDLRCGRMIFTAHLLSFAFAGH